MYLILSESDRERLGCPEKMNFKIDEMTAREQATIQAAFRYDDSFQLLEALNAMYSYDKETDTTTVRLSPEPMLSLAWLALRQSGVFTGKSRADMAAELDGLDIQIFKVITEQDEEELAAAAEATEVAEGKDESSTPTRTSTD